METQCDGIYRFNMPWESVAYLEHWPLWADLQCVAAFRPNKKKCCSPRKKKKKTVTHHKEGKNVLVGADHPFPSPLHVYASDDRAFWNKPNWWWKQTNFKYDVVLLWFQLHQIDRISRDSYVVYFDASGEHTFKRQKVLIHRLKRSVHELVQHCQAVAASQLLQKLS